MKGRRGLHYRCRRLGAEAALDLDHVRYPWHVGAQMQVRTPGRYNLHHLGWKSFEDLIIEVTSTILGETVTPFRVGADGGRDGFFAGRITGELATLGVDSAGKAVLQCKHCSTPAEGLKLADVSAEIPKIRALVARDEIDLFVIFSNRRLSGEDEILIRTKFEQQTGVKRCIVFGEEWIESKIDGNFRLLRRVPRLFGIGDLSQILSHAISQQTRLILDDLRQEQAVFVPTPSYRSAVLAVESHGFVALVGPPASGKSAIAINLCMTLGAENEMLEVIRLDTAAQMSETISAADPNKLYWIDDFLGDTTYDNNRASRMMAGFDRFRAAVRNGCKFILTTRDYILRDSHNHLRKSYLDYFENKAVMVRVDDLAPSEKERILYNHIKMGDLDRHTKKRLKPLLPMVARLNSFTPELARRLGTKRFHANLDYNELSIVNFVEKPVDFFLDVIHDLGQAERAAVAYILLSNNSLPDPILDVPPQIAASYSVDLSDIRRALEILRGSLTKLNTIGSKRVWQVHHPSMIDAMHLHIRAHESMLDLFIVAAPLEVLLRDCATVEAPNRLLVPETMYPRLLMRVLTAGAAAACEYIGAQSAQFIVHAISAHPKELAEIMGSSAETLGVFWGLRLLVRIRDELNINFELGQLAVESHAEEALWFEGLSEVLHHEDFLNPLNDSLVKKLVLSTEDNIDSTLQWMHDVAKDGGNSSGATDILQSIRVFRLRLEEAAGRLLDEEECQGLMDAVRSDFNWAERRVGDLIDEWDEPDYERDSWGSSPSFQFTADIFSDVDE